MEKNCLIHFGNQNGNNQFLQEANWVCFIWSFLSMDVDSCSVVLRSYFKKKDSDQYKLKDLYDSERIKKTNITWEYLNGTPVLKCTHVYLWTSLVRKTPVINSYLSICNTLRFIVRHYIKYFYLLKRLMKVTTIFYIHFTHLKTEA